jgi:hypothetical protein
MAQRRKGPLPLKEGLPSGDLPTCNDVHNGRPEGVPALMERTNTKKNEEKIT